MTATPNPPTPRGKVIQTNGVNLYYEEHGEGAPLLLLHAGSLSCDSWQPYLPALSAHYRVIAPDCRGHGRSECPTGTLSYRLLADDIAALAQALVSRSR